MVQTLCFLVYLVNQRRTDDGIRFDVAREDDDSIVVPDVGMIFDSGPEAPPPGAIWWSPIHARPVPGGPNFFAGDHLVVMTPGGLWNLDGRRPGCPLPNDKEHRCWERRGRPPKLSVECTCAEDPGSARIGSFYGALRDGWLISW